MLRTFLVLTNNWWGLSLFNSGIKFPESCQSKKAQYERYKGRTWMTGCHKRWSNEHMIWQSISHPVLSGEIVTLLKKNDVFLRPATILLFLCHTSRLKWFMSNNCEFYLGNYDSLCQEHWILFKRSRGLQRVYIQVLHKERKKKKLQWWFILVEIEMAVQYIFSTIYMSVGHVFLYQTGALLKKARFSLKAISAHGRQLRWTFLIYKWKHNKQM